MPKWKLVRIGADYETMSHQLQVDPVIVRLMRNKGLETVEEMRCYLDSDISMLNSSMDFVNMQKAIKLLDHARENHLKLRVIGDYDIDGICATAILVKGLRELEFCVDYAIPHRIHDGYGLNENLIRSAIDNDIDVIITCDNGISAFEPIALAHEQGLQVLLTDHHEVLHDENGEERIPLADVVINPKCNNSGYPFEGICGAYVAYHLLHAYHTYTFDHKSQSEILDEEREYLELAAFATVGDIMELKGENRALVRYGLKSMQHAANIGLRALIRATGKPDFRITAYTIGFVLGPCINATGRLDTAERALQLLLETDEERAFQIAVLLKDINEERKKLTLDNVAFGIKEAKKQMADGNDILVIYLPDCHESLAGIIAGKIREEYNRPTLVVTKGEEGLKGSARSVEAYDMFAGLCECEELFDKFGGHKMAAGFSLQESCLEELKRQLNQNCTLTPEQFEEEIKIDVDLPFSYVTMELLEQMELMQPFGNGNPKPVFAQKDVVFKKGTVFGKNRNCASYDICDNMGVYRKLKFFGDLQRFNQYLDEKFGTGSADRLYEGHPLTLSVIYYPEVNDYLGKKSIQFIMQSYV